MSDQPPARNPFRLIAACLAGACFVRAIVLAWFDDDNWQVSTRVFVYAGLILAVAALGYFGKRR